jgi:hypothetical protein
MKQYFKKACDSVRREVKVKKGKVVLVLNELSTTP